MNNHTAFYILLTKITSYRKAGFTAKVLTLYYKVDTLRRKVHLLR